MESIRDTLKNLHVEFSGCCETALDDASKQKLVDVFGDAQKEITWTGLPKNRIRKGYYRFINLLINWKYLDYNDKTSSVVLRSLIDEGSKQHALLKKVVEHTDFTHDNSVKMAPCILYSLLTDRKISNKLVIKTTEKEAASDKDAVIKKRLNIVNNIGIDVPPSRFVKRLDKGCKFDKRMAREDLRNLNLFLALLWILERTSNMSANLLYFELRTGLLSLMFGSTWMGIVQHNSFVFSREWLTENRRDIMQDFLKPLLGEPLDEYYAVGNNPHNISYYYECAKNRDFHLIGGEPTIYEIFYIRYELAFSNGYLDSEMLEKLVKHQLPEDCSIADSYWDEKFMVLSGYDPFLLAAQSHEKSKRRTKQDNRPRMGDNLPEQNEWKERIFDFLSMDLRKRNIEKIVLLEEFRKIDLMTLVD